METSLQVFLLSAIIKNHFFGILATQMEPLEEV
jgi:hypothetical protein